MGASVTHKPSRNNGVIFSRCINPFHPCSIFLLKLKVLIEGMLLVNQNCVPGSRELYNE